MTVLQLIPDSIPTVPFMDATKIVRIPGTRLELVYPKGRGILSPAAIGGNHRQSTESRATNRTAPKVTGAVACSRLPLIPGSIPDSLGGVA